MEPVLSILTVTFRDLPGLRLTLDSLRPLVDAAGQEVEVLVQDGGTEGIEAVAHDYPWAHVESARDGGIYEGMNAAVKRSTGAHLWFLNGGDLNVIASWPSVRAVLTQHPDEMCLFDYDLDLGHQVVQQRARDPRYLYHALPTSHQAILYPGAAVRSADGYDTNYRVVGDYELTARLWKQGVRTFTSHVPVAQFTTGGMSQQHARNIAEEARRVQQSVLHAPVPLQWASSALHAVSRFRRARATKQPTH